LEKDTVYLGTKLIIVQRFWAISPAVVDYQGRAPSHRNKVVNSPRFWAQIGKKLI